MTQYIIFIHIYFFELYAIGLPMQKMKTKPCPLCGKPAAWEANPYRPFCSKRCKIIDLGDWANEAYRIPGEKANDGDIKKIEGEDEKNK